MSKLIGLAFILVLFAADVASAQTLRYVNRSNPGSSQLSNHRHFMGAQRRQQMRKFGYQRNAGHRQRMSQMRMRNIQRTAGQRATQTGTAAQVEMERRQQARNRQLSRRVDPTRTRTTRLQTVTQQRAEQHRRAAQRTSRRKSRTLDW